MARIPAVDVGGVEEVKLAPCQLPQRRRNGIWGLGLRAEGDSSQPYQDESSAVKHGQDRM